MYSFYSLLIVWIIIGTDCALIAKSKGRNPILWFILGAGFSLLALVPLLLLSAKVEKKEEITRKTIPSSPQIMSQEAALSADDLPLEPTPIVKRIPSDPTLRWYLINENVEVEGPMIISELRKQVVTRKLDLTTYIWCDEFPTWMQILEFQNLSILTDPDLII